MYYPSHYYASDVSDGLWLMDQALKRKDLTAEERRRLRHYRVQLNALYRKASGLLRRLNRDRVFDAVKSRARQETLAGRRAARKAKTT
jgi:hypothetical protein